MLLVFALINRPDIFDLRPGNSFVEFLLDEGYDVFLLDWGVPDDEDADLGLEHYVCDEIPSAHARDAARASAQEEVTLLGWCIGGTLSLHALRARARHARAQPRPAHDADRHDRARSTPPGSRATPSTSTASPTSTARSRGGPIDWANKLMKPVTNYWTTYRRLWEQVLDGEARRDAYQAMAKWVADNPPFPGRAYREWITWMYKENRLVRGRMRLRGRARRPARRSSRTCSSSPPAPTTSPRARAPCRCSTWSRSEDVTHLDRPGGHIGLMAGSKARKEIWPDIAEWLGERSDA